MLALVGALRSLASFRGGVARESGWQGWQAGTESEWSCRLFATGNPSLAVTPMPTAVSFCTIPDGTDLRVASLMVTRQPIKVTTVRLRDGRNASITARHNGLGHAGKSFVQDRQYTSRRTLICLRRARTMSLRTDSTSVRRVLAATLVAALTVCLAGGILAGTHGGAPLRGRVLYRATMAPVPGVLVEVVEAEDDGKPTDEVLGSAHADAEGRFTVELPEGHRQTRHPGRFGRARVGGQQRRPAQ